MQVIIVCSIFSVICAVVSLIIVGVMIRKANMNARDERKRETKLFKLYEALEEMIDDFEKYVDSSKGDIAHLAGKSKERQIEVNPASPDIGGINIGSVNAVSPNSSLDISGIDIESKADDQFLKGLYTNSYVKEGGAYGKSHQIPVQKPFQTQILAPEEPKRGRGRPRKSDEDVKRVPPKVNLITNDNVVRFTEPQGAKSFGKTEETDEIFGLTVELPKVAPVPLNPNQEILRLLDEGKNVDEIARILKRSKGEIELIKGFAKKS